MEKSFLSFVSSYPSWQPNAQGMKFLTTLKTFRDQKLPAPICGYTYSPLRLWEPNPYSRQQSTTHSYFRRGAHPHLGSLWLIETHPNPHPYLLDWYYLSRPHQNPDDTFDGPTVAVDINDNEQSKDFHAASFCNEARRGGSSPNIFEDRSLSHLEASTSSPMEQSVLRHQESSSRIIPQTKNDWWARGGCPGGAFQEASFLEPPFFRPRAEKQPVSFLEPPEFLHHHSGGDFYSGQSENSIDEEQEQQLDWRNYYHNLSRTSYPGEFGDVGELKLHFDDIFGPSEPPLTSNPDHADFD